MAISWLRFGLTGGVQRFSRPHTPRPSLRLHEAAAAPAARRATRLEIHLDGPINWGAVEAALHAIGRTAAAPEPPEESRHAER